MAEPSPPASVESRTQSRLYVIHPPDGGRPFLLLELLLDCPLCGQQRIQLAGHHLKMVRDIAIEAIDAFPELTAATVRVGVTEQVAGRANDPETS